MTNFVALCFLFTMPPK
jgi:hypothetical protein